MRNNARSSLNSMTIGGIILRIITSSIILSITAFFTPRIPNSIFWDFGTGFYRTCYSRLFSKCNNRFWCLAFWTWNHRICNFSYYTLFNTIFCKWFYHKLDFCHNWRIDLWNCRLYNTRQTNSLKY